MELLDILKIDCAISWLISCDKLTALETSEIAIRLTQQDSLDKWFGEKVTILACLNMAILHSLDSAHSSSKQFCKNSVESIRNSPT